MNFDDLVSTLLPMMVLVVFFISMGVLSVLFVEIIRIHRRKGPTNKVDKTSSSSKDVPYTESTLVSSAETALAIDAESPNSTPTKQVGAEASNQLKGDTRGQEGVASKPATGGRFSFWHSIKSLGKLGSSRKSKFGQQTEPASIPKPVGQEATDVDSGQIIQAAPSEPAQIKPLPEPALTTPSQKLEMQAVNVESQMAVPSKVDPVIPRVGPQQKVESKLADASGLPRRQNEPQQRPEPPKQTDDADAEIKIKPVNSLADAAPVIKAKIKEKPANSNNTPAPQPKVSPPAQAKPAASSSVVPETDNVMELLGSGAKLKPESAEAGLTVPARKADAEVKVENPEQKAATKTGSAVYVDVTSTSSAQKEVSSNDVPALLYTDSVASILTKQDATGGVQNFSVQLNELRDTLSSLSKTLKKLKSDEPEKGTTPPADPQNKDKFTATSGKPA